MQAKYNRRRSYYNYNLAGASDRPRPYLEAKDPMTFTYALVGGEKSEAIILAADSQITYHHCRMGEVIGTYENQCSKIRRIGGRWAFSMAGNRGLIEFLVGKVQARGVDPNQSFESVVREYQKALKEEYQRSYGDNGSSLEAVFIFCGYSVTNGVNAPCIVRLDSETMFEWSPSIKWHWSGAYEHGAAIYLHTRFVEGKVLSVEQAKLAAYCIVSEVADQDNSVGGVIEVEVITPEGSSPLSGIPKYEAARQQLIRETESFLVRWKP